MAACLVLIALASLIWVPIGVWVGLRPPIAQLVQPVAQFLAAFPANLLFPLVVSVIVTSGSIPNIWLSPLMILGTQWYILFNVIAGASAHAQRMRDAGTNLGVRGWLWWRRIALPGGVSLLCHRRHHRLGRLLERQHRCGGGDLGQPASAGATAWAPILPTPPTPGDFRRVVLGIAVMSFFVVVDQSRVLAAALLLRRTQIPLELREMATWTSVQPSGGSRRPPHLSRPTAASCWCSTASISRSREGEIVGPARPLGLGQVHPAAPDRGPVAPQAALSLYGPAHRGPGAGRRHGVPELRAVSLADGAGECAARA